jgi:rhamnosyltransferase subunit B
MAHYLLTPFGSAGDVNPFIWMGSLLKAHGHEVEIITAPMFRENAERAGLPFIPLGDEAELMAILHDPNLWRPYHGTKIVFKHGAAFLRPCFDAIAARVRKHGTVLVSPFHLFSARIAREKFRVPLVSVHLQPACFFSAHDMPLLIPGTEWVNRLPVWVKRFVLALPNPAAGILMPALRRVCVEEGIAAPKRPIPDWMHSPDVNLALFPEWFAKAQPDWPEHTHTVGFPLEDLNDQFTLPAESKQWIAEGKKPVLFSPGTGNAQAKAFFQAALEACKVLGFRALLGTRFPEQLPSPLPPFARQFDYLPFSALLPHVSALVHHGGIGTLSQALAAGVPQLVMPMAHDQPDNAHRLQRLRVGDSLSPKRFTGERVAEMLRRLISDQGVAEACARTEQLCKAGDAASKAVHVLESAAFVE